MTERERLVNLLNYVRCFNSVYDASDYLIDNGVIVPPCKVGAHLYRVTKPYRAEHKVTEFIVKNICTVGKKHKIMLEVQALNVPVTNVMEFEKFYETREEAEKALNERANKDAKN